MTIPIRSVIVREADSIWHEQGGWFDARWHFSFDRYRDPENDGVGALRVFNDDRIVAGAEWPMHPHQDIETNTYVVSGHFLHADSLGNNGRLEAGAAQVMTFSHAGDLHSEKNGSTDQPMRFIQFWILPSSRGLRRRSSSGSTRSRTGSTAGCRSWDQSGRTASTWHRTRAPLSRT